VPDNCTLTLICLTSSGFPNLRESIIVALRLRESEAPSELRTCEDSIPAEKLKFQNFFKSMDGHHGIILHDKKGQSYDDKKGLDTSSDKYLTTSQLLFNLIRNWIEDGRLLWIESTYAIRLHIEKCSIRGGERFHGERTLFGEGLSSWKSCFQNPYHRFLVTNTCIYFDELKLESLKCLHWPAFQSIFGTHTRDGLGEIQLWEIDSIIPWFVKQT